MDPPPRAPPPPHPYFSLSRSYFGYFDVPTHTSIEEFFSGVNMMALVCALLFTFVAAIPIAWTTDELLAMDNRIWAGADMWHQILKQAGGRSLQ